MARKNIALIRGINVGKAKRISMTELRELCDHLGFKDIRTLLNSGNIVFTVSGQTPGELSALIENGIFDSFGISAKVLVITDKDLIRIVEENPLAKMALDPSRLLVTVLKKPSDGKNLKFLEKLVKKPEAMSVGKLAVYQWCPEGILKSAIAQAVAHELGDSATSRNWATMLRLYAMVTGSE